ncbi:BNR-4 repeat-containing protein [Algibacillus agarilyticus]|uniref:BNR-4 repeat-containing protein n=1 Tax=Algibacillus agarilyticus TaxID=2234133 RepID=UPI000DD04576|nr:BNR-4 repeat-containing protein [Algibacillus agarilyticus]
MINKIKKAKSLLLFVSCLGLSTSYVNAAVTLENEIKITNHGLHFDGANLDYGTVGQVDETTAKYDYFFGPNISAHGDSVKTYGDYVFTTWYRGGKFDRHVMLSRVNTVTGSIATIEFPHQHTGFRGNELIGESHNTIAVAISPINGSIHMLYDMHAYDDNNHGGKFKDDYFRYSYSVPGAADVPDNEFTLNKFVKDTSSINQGADDYKHLTMTGNLADKANFSKLTYPTFFTNTDGTLLLYMRAGGNNNGGYVFNRYDAATKKWSKFTDFNVVTAKNYGNDYNWGLYGHMKYVNGKLRVGFQQRSSDNSDRYKYQNGVYYAYSDHPEGNGNWKNHKGQSMTFPLVNSDEIKVFEPGDYIDHAEANSVYIVGYFDWTVTDNGDVHMISKVRSSDRNRADYQEVDIHSYKPAGATNFTHSTDFTGATNIYTSGNNIYIIGLNSNGYPYVEKAVGGTNNFTPVYEATSGTQFNHGRVHIADGKLYYYLMERSTGTTRPLHLQIIDLDINANPIVTFPQSSVELDENYETLSFDIAATSPTPGVAINNVKLYVDGQLLRQENIAPYEWGHAGKPNELLGLSIGEHTLTAIATDENGLEGEASITVVVTEYVDPTPIVTFPQTHVQLDEGYEALSFDIAAVSPIADVAINNVKLYVDGELLRQENVAPYEWGHAGIPDELLGLSVGQHTLRAVATNDNGLEGEASIIVVVNDTLLSSCTSITDVAWDTRTEVALSGNNSCIRFNQNLSGKTVQFWDSEENSSCDFRGVVSSVDGNGEITVTSNYKQSSDYTGTVLALAPNNGCQYIKVRAF